MNLPNCWEIYKCGHVSGDGPSPDAEGCIAARENLGHSCWTLDGTVCAGKRHGSAQEKKTECGQCRVFHSFKGLKGRSALEFERLFEDERKRYHALARTWVKIRR
jgi:hypothetical protein